ncbi:MAG TPA: glycosyltransferase, partial [Pyrinomonadaceae bacterium]
SLLELGAHNPPTWLGEFPDVKYFSLGATRKALYPRAVLQLSQFLKREKIDILQTHLFYAGLIGVLAKRLYRKTIVVLTRHHTSIVRILGSKYHLFLDKWMAEQADYVVAVSEATRNYMKQVDGIRGDHIETVHLGFDFEKRKPNSDQRKIIRDEFGFTEKDFVVGYVANLLPGKGHLRLIEAFSEVVKEASEARLFLVGHSKLAEVDQAIEEFSLQQKVVLTGWRDDVAACLNAIDLFVHPSLSEAFSQVLIEALSVRLPVVITNVGGASEVITDGENGFLIEPDNAQAIRDKILELYGSKPLRDKIAFAGHESARRRFNVEQMVNRQFELYENWLKKRK